MQNSERGDAFFIFHFAFLILHFVFFFPMPDFAYTARDTPGKLVEGLLAAGAEREAVATLAAKDLFPVKVTSAEKWTATAGTARVRARIMAATYGQLSALLGSGVPLLRSLEVI